MSCTHPRQPYPAQKSTAMPCAWPDCEDGTHSSFPLVVDIAPDLCFSVLEDPLSETHRPKRMTLERREMFDVWRGEQWYEWDVMR